MNVADAFETIIIMTNNDMMKIGKQNLEEKSNLSKFKIEESWEVMEIDDELLKMKKRRKKDCC